MIRELTIKLQPKQLVILEALADGMPHRRKDLLDLIDEMASPNNLHVHISHIRKALRPKGEDIICELRGYSKCYRHVRLLSNPYK